MICEKDQRYSGNRKFSIECGGSIIQSKMNVSPGEKVELATTEAGEVIVAVPENMLGEEWGL